ncbi:hypothetical protein ACOME3_008836 [Neoechinorhynchus agilis]
MPHSTSPAILEKENLPVRSLSSFIKFTGQSKFTQSDRQLEPFSDRTKQEKGLVAEAKKGFKSPKLGRLIRTSFSKLTISSPNPFKHKEPSTAPAIIEDFSPCIVGQDIVEVSSPTHAVMGPSSSFEETINNTGFFRRLISRRPTNKWTLFPVVSPCEPDTEVYSRCDFTQNDEGVSSSDAAFKLDKRSALD